MMASYLWMLSFQLNANVSISLSEEVFRNEEYLSWITLQEAIPITNAVIVSSTSSKQGIYTGYIGYMYIIKI